MSNGIPPFHEVNAGGLRWLVQADVQNLLLGSDGLRLEEWRCGNLIQVVKHGPQRTIYRVRLPSLDLHVKHFRLPDTQTWLREWLRPSKARLEFDRLLAAARRGIATVVPLAVGQRTGLWPRESFLVTLTLQETEPLGTFLEQTLPTLSPERQVGLRHQIADILGRFMAHMHQVGITHHDLHPNNLLFRLGPDQQPTLFLIDLHAVRFHAGLSWRSCRGNLVILNRWFIMRANRSDRLRFWKTYCEARWGPGAISRDPHWTERARDLERRTWESNLCFWRQRDRRCRENNRYYRRLRSPAATGFAVADLDPTVFADFLRDPDEPFRRPGVILLKDSRSSTVAELELTIEGARRRVIYKRFRVTTRSDPWVSLLRRSPALRSWVHGHGLRERCLPTPRPLAVLHRRRHGLAYEGYLLTEKVLNCRELAFYVKDLETLPAPHGQALRRNLIDRVAFLVRALHARHLSHRDLKAANILVQQAPDFGRDPNQVPIPGTKTYGPLWLIDLVGVQRHRRVSKQKRIQNLTRLHVSSLRWPRLTRTDKLRFLRIYFGWGLTGKQGWKEWWRAIARETQAKVERNARRGRPLA
jgi:tRNA A-37 threonylcarbamoyl transferase component Bud32